jgi:hypothetical protein
LNALVSTTTAPRDQLPIQDAFSRQKALLQGFVSWSCIVVEINADTSLVTLSFLMPTFREGVHVVNLSHLPTFSPSDILIFEVVAFKPEYTAVTFRVLNISLTF